MYIIKIYRFLQRNKSLKFSCPNITFKTMIFHKIKTKAGNETQFLVYFTNSYKVSFVLKRMFLLSGTTQKDP